MDKQQQPTPSNDHWLVRASTIRMLWLGGCTVLAVTVFAEFLFPIKGFFSVDNWPGFAAVFGFLSCVAMIAIAKLLGVVLKRQQDYYGEETSD